MGRFWGNHSGTRQVRGSRKIKPASQTERLASMERELANRIKAYGFDSQMVRIQREAIARELARQA